ncbi:Uncharacterised protein [Yersinia aldovae]|uniref:Uncharacterized protein n=1 Tax=Yersinia aldovae TaxID=29483 RepID=A0ABM9SXG2_YERAL|nr:Uncharacterised protein [Yersinia aldovae]
MVMDNKTTVTKIVGMGSKGNSFGEWNTGITIPSGYDYFLWMSSYAWLDYTVSGSQWVPGGFAYNQPYLDANRTLKVNSVNYYGAIPSSYYGVYIWPASGSVGGYGIQFMGVNNFTGISNISQFTCLLFKGEVDINDGWLPSYINPAFAADQVMCYFYTEDTSKTICMSPDPTDRRYRVALRQHISPVSQILAKAIKFLADVCPGLRLIVSYADKDQNHHGGIYQATNWIYEGLFGAETVGAFIIKGKKTHPRSVSAKGVKQNLESIRQHLDPNAQEFKTSGKHKYLMPLDKKMKKILISRHKPYPKRA